MSEINLNVKLPLDDGFLRRECPFCCREFKIQLQEQELEDLAQKGLDSFLIKQEDQDSENQTNNGAEIHYWCPHCGQEASEDSWWTEEQLAYFGVYARNIMAKLVNENLIRPLKRGFRGTQTGLISLRFEGKEMEQREPWISPEPDDMKVFELPCCQRRMKIEEGWQRAFHCFICGFTHKK